MKLSELIAAYGDDKVQFQNLDHSATSMHMKGSVSKITFGTEQRLSFDGIEKLGLVVWLDRDRVKEILAAPAPEDTARLREEKRCTHCDGTGNVHRADGEWLGECYCPEGRLSLLREDLERVMRFNASMAEEVVSIGLARDAAERERDDARKALEPFARAARCFRVAIGPDGMDDGLTVLAHIHAKPEYEAQLSTADFSAAARSASREGASE